MIELLLTVFYSLTQLIYLKFIVSLLLLSLLYTSLQLLYLRLLLLYIVLHLPYCLFIYLLILTSQGLSLHLQLLLSILQLRLHRVLIHQSQLLLLFTNPIQLLLFLLSQLLHKPPLLLFLLLLSSSLSLPSLRLSLII